MRSGVVLVVLAACGASNHPGWLSDARVVVDGVHADASDCRTQICVHNENTDLTVFDGATYLVHRTATSQILGPNSCSAPDDQRADVHPCTVRPDVEITPF